MTDTTPPNGPDGSNRRRNIIIGVVGAVVVLGLAFGAFAIWFLQDDSPDEVSIDSAAAQVGATTTEAAAAEPEDTADDDTATDDAAGDDAAGDDAATDTTEPDADPEPEPEPEPEGTTDLSGTWSVDTTIGEFSYEDSTGTFVGFRIAEELSGIGSTEAVGRTPAVDGTLEIDGLTIESVAIEADMTAITTNDSRRDDNVQRALDTGEFPTATFVLTEPIELGEDALAGEAVAVDAIGDLTIHGVTENVTFPLEAQLVEDTIVVVGSLEVVFADYGVEVPSAPIVISVEDNGPIELQLFFTR